MIRAENTWNEFRDPEGDEPVYDEKRRRLHYCKRCSKWAAVVEKADERQNIDIEMDGDDDVSIQ